MTYSSLRILFPLLSSPVRSARFISTRGTQRSCARFFSSTIGVGKCASGSRGGSLGCILIYIPAADGFVMIGRFPTPKPPAYDSVLIQRARMKFRSSALTVAALCMLIAPLVPAKVTQAVVDSQVKSLVEADYCAGIIVGVLDETGEH